MIITHEKLESVQAYEDNGLIKTWKLSRDLETKRCGLCCEEIDPDSYTGICEDCIAEGVEK